jgi:IclR family transcriptional regulator, KDG regulon repressor
MESRSSFMRGAQRYILDGVKAQLFRNSAMAQKPYVIRSVARALRMLEAVNEKRHDVTLTEIAKDLALPKTTAFRIAQTMSMAGFLRHDSARDRYAIGPRLMMFAEGARSLHRLRQLAQHEMEVLAIRYRETVNLGIISGHHVVYIEIICSDRLPRVAARIGDRHPIHSTALGKAMLAFLPDSERASILDGPLAEMTVRTIQSESTLRRQLSDTDKLGFALEVGETEDGFSCIGVPIFGEAHYPLAGLSMSAPDKRLRAVLPDVAADLRAAANSISMNWLI